MPGQTLVERVKVSDLSPEDIKNCYDPSKAGFDIRKYLALPEKKRENVYWEQSEIFFNSPFNGGTINAFLEELKYDPRFTEGSDLLLFTDGSYHSRFKGGFLELYEGVISAKVKETQKMWFFGQLRGYGFEHYLDGISGFGEPYSARIDKPPR